MAINPRPDDEPVQDCFDEGVFVLAHFEIASEIALEAIDTHATITLQAHLLERVLPALAENLEYRRAQLHLSAWGQLQHAFEHLPRRTSRDRFLAPRAIRRPK